ncbi:MAG TPA: PAS domain S-box protein [Candidatus Limnocylindrales bacterium]
MPSKGREAPILVVDDDTATRELVATHLRREGFDVREAASGEAALELMAGQKIGLVILDMGMPGMSGLDVIRALREQPKTATLPIMVLTGMGDEYPLVTSLGIGADDYLPKPIRLDEIAARVRARLRNQDVAAEQALRASDDLYRALVEQSADGVLVSDQTGRYVEANPAICRMLGYSHDELLATFTPSLSADDDRLTPDDMDVRLAETVAGAGLLVERRYRRKDGTSLPAEVSFSQLPDGRLQRNIRDITERLAAEVALRESERTLAEAQRIAHVGSWDWDLASDTARRSDETNRIFGVERGGLAGATEAFLAVVHPEDRARVRASERAAISQGAPHDLDYRIIRPDGEVRLIHEEGEVIRDGSGSPVRMVGTVQDITARRGAEAERARLVSAVEQTADAIWMNDMAGTITYVNPAFTRAYGYESGEAVGQHAGILDSGSHEPAFFAAIWDSVRAGQTWTGTIVNRRKDGTPIDVESVISAIHDADGQLTGYIQADRDVTHERELERTLVRNARERDAIETALARIDPAASAEEIAAEACVVINGLPGVDSTMAVALDQVEGAVLAVAGQLATTFAPGTRAVAASRAAYLRERGSSGPWYEKWRPGPDTGAWTEAITATGLLATAYAPLRSPRGVVGVVGIASHDPATAHSLVEHMPALTAFVSILGALLVPKLEERRHEAEGRSVIQAVLDTSAFAPFFQPIVDIYTGAVVGYEALSRFTDGVPPDLRFAAAAKAGLGIELEMATLRGAIAAAAVLPPDAHLSLNASPALITSGALRALFAGVARPLVLEITEHIGIDDYAALRSELAVLGPTVRLAVDDAGAGYASFRHILELAPSFVKLDIGLIRGINTDPARQALLAGMAYFAVKRRIRLVAEGIETSEELRTLRSLAIPYGQGYLLGRPQDGRGSGPWPNVVALGTRSKKGRSLARAG